MFDQNGQPFTGAPVTFSVASGGGTVSGATATTATGGTARPTQWVLGQTAGPNTLVARSTGLPDLTFSATATPGAVTRLLLTAGGTSSDVGVVAPTFTVRVADAFSNVVAEAGRVITVTTPTTGVALAGTSATTDTTGTARFTALVLRGTAGAVTLRFGSGTLPAADATITLRPGAPATVTSTAFTAFSSGVALTTAPTARLVDESGNPAPRAGVQVTVAATSPAYTVTNGTATTDSTGLAAFPNFTVAGPVGSFSLSVTPAGGTALTRTATMSAGPSSRVVIRPPAPTTATSGTALSPAPVLQLVDAQGNEATAPSRAVRVTVASSTGGTAFLSSDTVRTDANGRATFTGLAIVAPAGTVTLRFTALGGDGSAVTMPVTVSGGTVPAITLDSAQVSFSGTAYLASPSARTVGVSNAGTGTLSGLTASVATGAAWLAATLNQSTAPATLTLTPTITGLAAGTYSTTVTVSSTVAASVTLPVTLTLGAPSVGTVRYGTTTQNVYEVDLAASVQPPTTVTGSGGADLSGLPRTYTSRAPSVATVDSTGRVTGVANGQTFVILEVAGSTLVDSVLVNVTKGATQPVLRAAVLRYDLTSSSTVSYTLTLDLRGRSLTGANLSVTWPFDFFTGFLAFSSFSPNTALGGALSVNSTLAAGNGVLRLGIASSTPLTGVVTLGTLTMTVPTSRAGRSGRLSLLGTELLDGSLADFTTAASLLTYQLVVR